MHSKAIELRRALVGSFVALLVVACSAKQTGGPSPFAFGGSPAANGGSGAAGGVGGATGGSGNGMGGFIPITFAGGPTCLSKTCKELGYACGSFQNDCGGITHCADEGLKCNALEACLGGVNGPTECTSTIGPCEVCGTVPDCTNAGQPTRLSGRVITPGRNDADTANQVGVPNAVVYILRSNDLDAAELPAIPAGIPADGMSCDRCEDQKLGRVLVGTTTDSTGRFTLEGLIPVGGEFTLVVKVGRFRRATRYTLPASAACQTTALPTSLPDNPTRLPRTMTDGVAVNIPNIAVSTGQVDAMECVLEKMGIADSEFGNPGTQKRVHLYRGGRTAPGAGASIDSSTPLDTALYGSLARLSNYDILIADCEGVGWDETFTQRAASGSNVREYVNRGGRMFASHLSFSWLEANGTDPYDPQNPIAAGLDAAATWNSTIDSASDTGNGVIANGRPQASPRIQSFSDWAAAEGIVTPPATSFTIIQPRSHATKLGASTEEFVYRTDGTARTQQFSFNTPYGAPSSATCGRVAYSGFHVAATGDDTGTQFANSIFPAHCVGPLTSQEKVLLYMLFDLGACIGTPPPPEKCTPTTCQDANAKCGYIADGCGSVVDCGVCPPPK